MIADTLLFYDVKNINKNLRFTFTSFTRSRKALKYKVFSGESSVSEGERSERSGSERKNDHENRYARTHFGDQRLRQACRQGGRPSL